MAELRCPKHDVVFSATTDQRFPGAGPSTDGKLPAHPENCHPDCPVGQKQNQATPAKKSSAVIDVADSQGATTQAAVSASVTK